MRPKSVIGIVRTYFPRVSRERAAYIMWEHTGYPEFWNIPEDGNTPEQCFRKQLREFRRHGRGCIRCGKHHVLKRGAVMCAPCEVAFEVESSSALEPEQPPAGPLDSLFKEQK